MTRKGKVLLIYTGGTIGMGVNHTTGALHPLDFNNFLNNVPEFKYLKTAIDTYQFTPPIDSSDMTPELWTRLVSMVLLFFTEQTPCHTQLLPFRS